jgi:ABC-type multidrug transport system fused ATPase/permease subunit
MYTYKFTVFFYLLFTIINYPLQNIYIPDYYGKVISSFKDGNNLMDMAKMLFILYTFGRTIDELVWYCQYLILPEFSEYITGSIFSLVVNNFGYDFENIKIGEIISKITKMPDILFDYGNLFRTNFLKEVFVFVAGFIHYSSISYSIVGIFAFFICIYYLYFFIMLNQFYLYNKKVNEFQDKVYENLNDTMQNISSVYSLNQQKYEKKRFYEVSFAEYKEIFGASYLYYLYSYGLWAFVNITMFITLNYVLYNSYKSKIITSTQLISSFIITWSILNVYQNSIESAWNLSEVYGGLYNVQDYFNELSIKNKSLKTNVSRFTPGDIIISNVYHKYGDDFVLENISIQIKKGEKVAFVGKIGSGKSTLIKLMMGYQPLVMGSIKIGGISVNEISNDDIRTNIFYIPQKPKLFNRTLYQNIVYGIEKSKAPSKEQIADIMKIYGISFERDMNDLVGVEGNSLSGGQRQMVWLLRSVINPASILVMDEPTSALDPANKKLINSIINKISVGKTVIIVSHDSIDPAFRKIKFTDGKLSEYSSIDELF